MSDERNYLSRDTSAHCGYEIEANCLRKSRYYPDPNDRRTDTTLPSNHDDDGMLYDPMDIGTDLCK